MFTKLKNKYLLRNIKNYKIYTGNLLKGGAILDITFRRNLLEKTIYNFAGICISFKKRGIASNIIVRNVISLYTIEYSFNIFSPLVKIVIRNNSKLKRSKLYFLREKAAPFSKVNFQYVT